ncbi:hypothetical protein J3U01_01500 [Bifidobacterium sp. B4107]|nr:MULTISPECIES: hypothetical protein [unclassified Bifidobacterium]MCX8647097.1 hypothetical protein [Bifidobacterium sp. B4107]MCX8651277.1 hypothetical protein [Bifidobacterium sp. B4111]
MDTNAWLVLTGVLTALFTGIAIVQRVIERPRPSFSVFVNSMDIVKDGEISCFVAAVNDGNGQALDCSIEAPHSSATNRNHQNSSQNAYLQPGEYLSLSVTVHDKEGKIKESEWGSGWPYDGPIPDNDICVKVLWHQAPYRRIAHCRKYRLSKLPIKQVFY